VPSPETEIHDKVQEFVEALDGVTYSSFGEPEDLAVQVVCDIARFVQSA
jgi:hypothetical protein